MRLDTGTRLDSGSIVEVRRAGYLTAGFALLALGIVGAFLPVMPTTIFLILAAWCFGRSSPKLETWMLNHPQFGPSLRAWREQGAISHKGKIAACAGMSTGFLIFLFGTRPALWLAGAVAVGLLACAVYVVTRPVPRK